MNENCKSGQERVIAVFGRRPEAGKAKTRLAARIGAEAATQLYAAMLNDCLGLAQRAAQSCDGTAVFAYTPRGAFARNSPHSLASLWRGRRRLQRGDDLGARMAHVFTHLQTGDVRSVLIIGSDAPDLPSAIIAHAWQILESRIKESRTFQPKLVLGPSVDGGFYLIGAHGCLPTNLFRDVTWSHQSTLQQVLHNAQQLGLTTDSQTLPIWRDVDDIDDLRALDIRLKLSPPDVAPRSRQWLHDQSTLMA